MKEIQIYADGACSGNPGIGGYGAILIYNEHIKSLSGVEKLTTNNRMELTAVIVALKQLKEKCIITIYSDSAYVVNAFNLGWVYKWADNHWTKPKGELLNVDLWQELLELVTANQVTFVKVKGHSDNEYNNQCDRLARGEVDKMLKEQK